MPLTKLDTTATLVVIDLQKGVVGLPTVHITGERPPRRAPRRAANAGVAFDSSSRPRYAARRGKRC